MNSPSFYNFRGLPTKIMAMLAIAFLSSCYEPKSGCLDPDGTNFDFTADEACADCCTFPKVTLSMLHQVALPGQPDTFFSFSYKKLYPSPFDPNNYFFILRNRYFISGLHLVRPSGEEVRIEENIELTDTSGVIFTVENNFAKIDRDNFQPTVLGTVRTKGVFDRIKFQVGLPTNLFILDPASVPDKHPLSTKTDTLIHEDGVGYFSNVLIFYRDDQDAPPVELRFQEGIEVVVPLPEPVEVRQGRDLKITLRVDYLAWFKGVDLKNDSEVTIRQKILENLPTAFSVVELADE